MIKQLLLISILVIGLIASVLLIQNSTDLKSKAYDLLDFIPSFHASENDPNFNGNLDVYKDGVINAFDIIKDRFLQESTKSGIASPSAEASSSATTPSPTASASPTVIPIPSPTPSPTMSAANEYQRILNGSQ